MPYYLRGNLWGYICRECPRPLWGVIVRVYAAEGERLIERAVADPKLTTTSLADKDVKARAGRLLAEATVGEDGSYEIVFDKKSRYQGGPVDIDLRIESVAHLDERAPKAKPRQVHVTTLQPSWREQGEERIAFWEYYLPARIWCLILSWFDIWVICGRVTICETDKALGGLTVEARDVDWVQQDYLGSAVTDGTGRFVIYYPGSAFRYGTWLDIELTGGPDLYFTIKTQGGTVLLAEPPSRGRQPDRENVGNCFCVELCVDDGGGDEEGFSVFTRVGKYIYATHIDSGLAQSGLTNVNPPVSHDVRAFYGTMPLRGVVTPTPNLQVEYCFEWREIDATGAIELHPWTQVTQGQIAPTLIGTCEYYDGVNWATTRCMVNGTGAPDELPVTFTSDGWIQVPLKGSFLTPPGKFTATQDLINLMSNLLVPFGSFNMSGKTAGASAAPLGANRYFGLRMRARAGGVAQVPPAGLLNKIAINNKLYDNLAHHPSWGASPPGSGERGVNLLDIQELIGNGCKKITNSLTILVTAAHPTLGAVTLSLQGGNAATVGPSNTPAVITAPSAGLPGQVFGQAGTNFSVTNLSPCAYILGLSVELMLTDGLYFPLPIYDQIAFAKS